MLDQAQAGTADQRARIENLWLQRPGLVVGLTLALCGLAATQLHKVYFDYNLLNMQSAGLPAVEFEKDLISAANAPNQTNASPKSVLYAAVVATNLQQAVALEQQLTNLPAVAGVESMSKYLAEDPDAQTGADRRAQARALLGAFRRAGHSSRWI